VAQGEALSLSTTNAKEKKKVIESEKNFDKEKR
jgi:hypothetical protein